MADENSNSNGSHHYDNGLVARLGAKVRKYADLNKATARERDDLRAKLQAAEAEMAQLKPKLDNSATLKEIARLQQEIRTRDHRVKFDALAKAAKVREEALSDLYDLSGYKAEGDVVDEEAIAALIEEQRGKRGYLFNVEAPAPPATPPAARPGPASGRSGGAGHPGAPTFTQEQMADPVFVMKNYGAIVEAAKAGTIKG